MSALTREAVAQARLKAASEHVENAQHELERAVSALATLNYMLPEMAKVAKLRDRIHEAFYRLAPISFARAKACAKATLDRAVEPGDEESHRGCCAGFRPHVLKGSPSTWPTPMVSLVCGGTARCVGVVCLPAINVDVSTSEYTDKTCGTCGAEMVVLP